MKQKLLSSLAMLAVVLAALALTGCGDTGSGNQNMPEHQHSH